VLGPYFDENPFGAGGASRVPNGKDTDSISDRVRNDFSAAGLPSFPGVQAAPGEAINTPGRREGDARHKQRCAPKSRLVKAQG
jgi:hypothetical protein